MGDPLARRQQLEQDHDHLPVRMDVEVRGLRCPVDRCDGELLVSSQRITTAPQFLREQIMERARGQHYRQLARMDGWVEIEYECLGCGAEGRMKANMAEVPIMTPTPTGFKYTIVLGPPPPQGLL